MPLFLLRRAPRSRAAPPPAFRFRLLVAALLALWLVGQHAGAEHARDHLHHDADCAAYLAAAGPAVGAVVPLPLQLAPPAGTAVRSPSLHPRSVTARIRNRGPPPAPAVIVNIV